VTLAYRKRMADSPAYRLNHEEVVKALEEGIWFAESLDPKEIIADAHDHARAVVFTAGDGRSVELPARTVLVAAGTTPNITCEKEQPGTFQMDSRKKFFQGFRAEVSTAADAGPIPALHVPKRRRAPVSYGDNYPKCRQRRQGDGIGEARPHVVNCSTRAAALDLRPSGARRRGRARQARRDLLATVERVNADIDDRRSGREGARRRGISIRQFYRRRISRRQSREQGWPERSAAHGGIVDRRPGRREKAWFRSSHSSSACRAGWSRISRRASRLS
jgi:hypothetical protein